MKTYRKNVILKLVLLAAMLTVQTTLTSANPGITIDVTPINSQVAPPGTATYSVTVVSSSTETEKVNLSIVTSREGWSYSFGENDFDLPAGDTKTVALSIAVPTGIPTGDYLHDVRGFAIVPGFEGVFDEETFFLDVITTVIYRPPSATITNINFIAGPTWINWTWTNPTDPYFSHVVLYLNDTYIINISAPQNYYNTTGLTPDTSYELSTRTVDISGDINETWVNATGRTLPLPDTTPPTTNLALSGTLGNNDWYTSDVQVTLTAADNEGGSGVNKTEYSFDETNWNIYVNPFDISNEGTTIVYFRSTDNAGNVEPTKNQTIKIDKTTPIINGAATTLPNANGWYNSSVVVNFIASDTLSGIDIISPDITVSTEGANQAVIGTATDKAGNLASVTVSWINIDKTPPSIIGAATTSPNANGWYNKSIVIHFSASDELSGIDTVIPDATITTEGTDQSVVGAATDKAGNSANTTVSGINIDKTPPVISGAAITSPNSNGWYNSSVIVNFTASDSLSGVSTVTPDTIISTEGLFQSVTGTATDRADNSASFTVSGINIDKTPPTISGAATTPPNANGWYNNSVVIHFAASDVLSGINTVTPDTPITTEGASQSAVGSAIDKAGNSASYNVSGINIDKTPPVIKINTPVPYGLYTAGTALSFSATDSLSGVSTVVGNLTNTTGESKEISSGFTPLPGVYALVVNAIDRADNMAASDNVFFVFYDPKGGFATGGGWFYSDLNSTLPGGRANFGFEAKYKNGNSTGNLEFQYKDADINLKSTTIDWIVISGVSAQFQGTGTVNGTGLYTFRVLAKDNGEPGSGVDHFDITIWSGTNTDADPYHKAKNILEGGNIVIHKR